MPRAILVAFFNFFILFLSAQVYHYETGKAIPVSKPGQIIWKKGIFFNYPADYGTLVALENPANLRSNLINLPVIRINCTQPDSTLEPIFILNGGPGESNLQTHLIFSRLLDKHDIILMGYRGVDGSKVLSNNYCKNALFTDSLSTTNYVEIFNRSALQTLSNLKEQKIELQGYCLENVIGDIEAIRLNQNYPKLSFVAYSYGSMLAQLYEQMFPKQVNKMALIGARPLGNFKINDTLFFQQSFLMFKDFKLRNHMADSLLIDYNNILSKTENDTFLKANQLNPIRFSLFFYSQFYSVKKTDELFSIMTDGMELRNLAIGKKYKEFYLSYPNIEMCDIFLKKQNYFDCSDSDTIISNPTKHLINTVNRWYSPCQPYLNGGGKPVVLNSTQIPILFICAQYDIAAPINLIKKMHDEIYLNGQIRIIERCGHLDLFYEQKPQLDSLIYNYF